MQISIFQITEMINWMLVPGFEPGSKAREAFMMGHYTTRAATHRLVTRIYSERVCKIFTFTNL